MRNLFDVAGKVALVTGGSRGIGFMIARGLAANGVRVYIASRKWADCEAASRALAREGDCRPLPADLSTEAGAVELARMVEEREPRLHILVNNAGTNWAAKLESYPDHGWEKVMALNVKGAFHLTRACLPRLEAAATEEDPARIVNIGSIDGLRVPAFETYAYSASKAALHHLTRTLAIRLAGRQITVNAVAPGPFESKMMAQTLASFGDRIARACPLGRIGTPEDMAGVVLFLASRAGAYLTGTVIPVDGGLSIRPVEF